MISSKGDALKIMRTLKRIISGQRTMDGHQITEVALGIVWAGGICADTIDEKFQQNGLTRTAWNGVFSEFVMFIIHVTDQLVFDASGPDVRAKFMDMLFEQIQAIITHDAGVKQGLKKLEPVCSSTVKSLSPAEVIIKKCVVSFETTNQRSTEYATLTNEQMLLALGKRVSMIVNGNHDPIVSLSAADLVTKSIVHLRPEILECV